MDPGLEREIRSRNNQIRASGFVAECVVRSVLMNSAISILWLSVRDNFTGILGKISKQSASFNFVN